MRAAPILAMTGAGVIAVLTASVASAAGFSPIDVRVTSFDSLQVEPGSNVEFRGGLVLASRDRNFGSWSGLDFAADGTLYAVADDGIWLRLKLVETAGRLTGIASAAMAPLLDDAGRQILRKDDADAEGLRIAMRNGVETAFVSFEQRPDVRTFAGPDFATAKPGHMKLPPVLYGLPDNQGLEAVAVAPADGTLAGAIVVVAEHYLDRNGNHRAFILDGPHPGEFSIRRSDDFDVSDAAFLPNGDLLVLERKFGFPGGFSMRLRRIAAAAIAPDALVDGATLLTADGSDGIDNMEGMAVRPLPDGSALVTLISDDNHSFLERTILLAFAVKPSAPLLPRLRPAETAIQ